RAVRVLLGANGVVDLHDVRTELECDPGRVIDRVEALLAALLRDGLATRVGPDDEGHAEPMGLLAYLRELTEVAVLRRGTDIDRVPHCIRPEPHGVLDRPGQRAERLGIGRDPGLAVELQDEGNLARVLVEELLREPDVEGDGAEAALLGEVVLVLRVEGIRILEEVDRSVLEPLVDREDEERSAPGAVVVEEPLQTGPLARREAQSRERGAGVPAGALSGARRDGVGNRQSGAGLAHRTPRPKPTRRRDLMLSLGRRTGVHSSSAPEPLTILPAVGFSPVENPGTGCVPRSSSSPPCC